MTEAFFYSLISVAGVSAISVIGIVALALKEKILSKTVFVLVSLAAGALMGDAFIHLIPEAFESGIDPVSVSLLIIGGIILFFIIEKYLHWHHAHGQEEAEYHAGRYHERVVDTKRRIHPLGYLILTSDAFHNLFDGIIIGISYAASIEIGIATTIAVILHEIPQEIGDFGALLHAGFSKMRALFFNFLTALSAVFGAILAFVVGGFAESFVALMVPIAAGGFIYVAGSDLVPELHKTKKIIPSLIQLAALLVGIGAMLLLVVLE